MKKIFFLLSLSSIVTSLFAQLETRIISVQPDSTSFIQKIVSFDPFLETVVQSNHVTSQYHVGLAWESSYDVQNNTYIWGKDTIFRSQLGVPISQQSILPLDSPNHRGFTLLNMEYDTLNDFLVGFGAPNPNFGIVYYCQFDLQQSTFIKKILYSLPNFGTGQGNSTYDQVSGDIYVVGGHMGIRRFDKNGILSLSVDEPNHFIVSPQYDHQSKKLFCFYVETLDSVNATVTFRYIDPIDGSNYIIDTIETITTSPNWGYYLRGNVSIDELNRKYWIARYDLLQSFDLFSGKRLDSIQLNIPSIISLNSIEVTYESCDTNIITQPAPIITPLGTSAYFNSNGTFNGKDFEWQEFTERGFTRIRDTINYQGVKSQNLIIPSVDSSDHYKLFRCKISSNGCNEYSQEVRLQASELVGLEVMDKNDILIYPNPTNGVLNIEIPKRTNISLELEIMDSKGRTVHSQRINKSINTIDIKEFNSGVYFYNLKGNEILKTGKLIKQ